MYILSPAFLPTFLSIVQQPARVMVGHQVAGAIQSCPLSPAQVAAVIILRFNLN